VVKKVGGNQFAYMITYPRYKMKKNKFQLRRMGKSHPRTKVNKPPLADRESPIRFYDNTFLITKKEF